MRRKLTELTVQRLNQPGIVWDQLLPGFGIRIGARTRTWIVAVRRPGSNNPVRLKIGTYPAVGLAEARERARNIMGGEVPGQPVPLEDAIAAFLEHGMTKKGDRCGRAPSISIAGCSTAIWRRCTCGRSRTFGAATSPL